MSPQAKNLVVLAALLGVAGVLGAYAYFGVMKADEVEAERKEVSDKLFAAHEAGQRAPDGGALPEPDFTKLTVEAKGEVTVLEKKDGKWWITSPVSAFADEPAVNSLVAQLKSAKVKALVEEKPTDADLARYGLAAPRFTVKGQANVQDAQGGTRTKEISLQGGIENTFDSSVYLRKGDDPKVYAVDGFVRSSLEKSTYELRDKQVLSFDDTKLTRLEVKTKANAWTLERDERMAWRVSKPVSLAAETDTVISMFNNVKGERALSFPKDSPEERKRFGLETPAVDATFTLEGGGSVRLRLAKATVDGTEKGYALREDGDGALLAEVSVGALSHLDKPAQDLRDRTVLAFAKEKVHRVSFAPAGGGAELVVEKAPAPDAGEEVWVVAAPERGPAKKWKVSSVLWALGGLKASGFGPEKPKEWSKFGVGATSRTVTLFDTEGKVLARLQVGKEVPGKTNTVYVRGSQDQVLELDSSRLAEIPTTLDDVIERPASTTVDGGTATSPLGGPASH